MVPSISVIWSDHFDYHSDTITQNIFTEIKYQNISFTTVKASHSQTVSQATQVVLPSGR